MDNGKPALVLGIEVDGQATDQKATFAALGLSETDSMPWFATARGRIGYAIAPMWMIYATGGGAWADFKSTITAAGLGSATWEVSHGGWSAGLGELCQCSMLSKVVMTSRH